MSTQMIAETVNANKKKTGRKILYDELNIKNMEIVCAKVVPKNSTSGPKLVRQQFCSYFLRG